MSTKRSTLSAFFALLSACGAQGDPRIQAKRAADAYIKQTDQRFLMKRTVTVTDNGR